MIQMALVILAFFCPVMSITAFIIGYNINASKKIFAIKKKHKKTEDELLLERIENAHI